jgi:hypothetical protein
MYFNIGVALQQFSMLSLGDKGIHVLSMLFVQKRQRLL